jgi:hypothetical protein
MALKQWKTLLLIVAPLAVLGGGMGALRLARERHAREESWQQVPSFPFPQGRGPGMPGAVSPFPTGPKSNPPVPPALPASGPDGTNPPPGGSGKPSPDSSPVPSSASPGSGPKKALLPPSGPPPVVKPAVPVQPVMPPAVLPSPVIPSGPPPVPGGAGRPGKKGSAAQAGPDRSPGQVPKPNQGNPSSDSERSRGEIPEGPAPPSEKPALNPLPAGDGTLPNPGEASPPLRLVGVILGRSRMAILYQEERRYFVREGDLIAGQYLVERIQPGQLCLRAGERSLILRVGGHHDQ